MRKIKVGCWRYPADGRDPFKSEKVYCTFPKHGYGHKLVSCLKCGEVYAGDEIMELYLCPLEKKLNETFCIGCGSNLGESAKNYPDFYLGKDGFIHRAYLLGNPLDEDRIIREFWGLYEKD